MRFRFSSYSASALTLVIAFAACDNPTRVLQHEHTMPAFGQVSAGELSGLAKELRQVTARFNSTTQATAAGYHIDSPCVAVPGLGAMGFHWVNRDLVDPVFDPLHPEALLYIQDENGQYRLLGVEYIVINIDQPAPTFAGHPFDVAGAPIPVPHWTLHAWVHEENPSGLHVPFNPNVECI